MANDAYCLNLQSLDPLINIHGMNNALITHIRFETAVKDYVSTISDLLHTVDYANSCVSNLIVNVLEIFSN